MKKKLFISILAMISLTGCALHNKVAPSLEIDNSIEKNKVLDIDIARPFKTVENEIKLKPTYNRGLH